MKVNLKKGRPVVWAPPGEDMEPVTFYLRGIGHKQQVEIVEINNEIAKLKKEGKEESEVAVKLANAMHEIIIRSVQDWEGVDMGEGPAPCQPDYIEALFAAYPEAQSAVLSALLGRAVVEADEKKD